MLFFIKKEETKYVNIKYCNAVVLYFLNSIQYFCQICLIQRVLDKYSISTASGFKGSVLAAIFIGLSNVICGVCFTKFAYLLEKVNYVRNKDFISVPININNNELVVMFLVSILTYKFILWENFFRIVPSNLMSRGAFSHKCARIIVKKHTNASSNIRKSINNLGQKYGCHSCGCKKEYYIADHIPPNTVVKNNRIQTAQYLYPQCTECSQAVKSHKIKSNVLHNKMFRRCNIYIPTLFILTPIVREYLLLKSIKLIRNPKIRFGNFYSGCHC
ncbi:hypothetical protein HZS_879 [Henneguya salminicola]|nr:hypothetical protein HZS_879 [Henneguya salminicola]